VDIRNREHSKNDVEKGRGNEALGARPKMGILLSRGVVFKISAEGILNGLFRPADFSAGADADVNLL
jgi:hypothetical protein